MSSKTREPEYVLKYNDEWHSYYLNGKRCSGVSTIAKIPTDTRNLQMWEKRQVAIGLTLDPHLIENIAVDIENKSSVDKVVKDAIYAAKRNRAADLGTQKHRVLQLILLGREDELLTPKQHEDAEILKRTLDKYKLTPCGDYVEQFVIWPQHSVAGRFDAVVERPDGRKALLDLKSGANAVNYPDSTEVQLALYNRAPLVSTSVDEGNGRAEISQWRGMPSGMQSDYGYVMLVENDSTVGTLHEMDLQRGWEGAMAAFASLAWRRKYDKTPAPEVPAFDYLAEAMKAPSLNLLRGLWSDAKSAGLLTDELKAAFTARSLELKV